MTAEEAWRRFFDSLPGAWFGNRPDGELIGNVTIDAKFTMQAIPKIKRRYVILSTRASNSPGGLLFVIKNKPTRTSDVPCR